MTKAWDDVIKERRRQVDEECWSIAHDDRHVDGAMARAAAVYAYASTLSDDVRKQIAGGFVSAGAPVIATAAMAAIWPADWETWWKPKDRRRDLVRAAALLLAEIERLDRMEAA